MTPGPYELRMQFDNFWQQERARLSAHDYLAHGWQLAPVPIGHRYPNESFADPENRFRHPQESTKLYLHGVALCHARGLGRATCALRFRDTPKASRWLVDRGVPAHWLAHLLTHSVQISSCTEGAKEEATLLFWRNPAEALPELLPVADGALVFETEATLLPPSVNPDSGYTLKWVQYGEPLRWNDTNWARLPKLPADIEGALLSAAPASTAVA